MIQAKSREQPTIRIMLVDDHPAFRKGLSALMDREPDIVVVAEAADGHEAVALFRAERPDVTLMDLRLPGQGGVETTLEIRSAFPDARIIVLTTFDLDEDIYRAIQSGASAYLLKDTPEEEIAQTIRTVHSGCCELPPALARRLESRQSRPDLSQREMQVLHALLMGRSNKEIGVELCVCEATVKAHLKTLFAKLKVQDRTAAAIKAIRQGIVHL